MKTALILRELKKSDLKALADIIRETWNYDSFATPGTARKLAKLYLSTCLANQTYSRVAEVNGVPAGLILGKNVEKNSSTFNHQCRRLLVLFQLFISKEGRELLNFFKNIDDIDSRLLSQCSKSYKGEVTLFVLSPEYRGLGIGKKLFDCLLAYMKSQCIEAFYLYTDTSCNFGFYNHQGMKCRQQQKQLVNVKGQQKELEFYLYDMTV